MKEGNALSARILEELEEISKVVARTLLLSEKAQKSGDDGYWDGVALNLHSFYTAERIFEDIARTITMDYIPVAVAVIRAVRTGLHRCRFGIACAAGTPIGTGFR